MDQTVVRTSDPRELLVYAEHVLGFRPHESVVAISLRGPRYRTGLVARMDLADAGDPHAAGAIASRFVADGARRAVVLVHSADRVPSPAGRPRPAGSPERLPHARVAAAWRRALLGAGVQQVETWLVSPTRVRSYTCGAACCPPQGLVLDREVTQVGAELVLAGSVVADDRRTWHRDQLAAIAPVSAAVRRTVEAAARTVPLHATGDEASGWSLAWWRHALETLAEVSRHGGDVPDAVATVLRPEPVAHLLVAMTDHSVRDAMLDEVAPLEVARGGQGGDRPDDDAQGTDPIMVEAALALLRGVVARAAVQRRAEPLSLLAWLLWWSGEGAAAVLHAELALDGDPAHSLSALVLRAAEHGLRPRGDSLGRSGGSPDPAASAC